MNSLLARGTVFHNQAVPRGAKEKEEEVENNDVENSCGRSRLWLTS